MDECTFSTNRYYDRSWAPVADAHVIKHKWSSNSLAMVCGVISEESGKVWFKIVEKTPVKKGLNSDDICSVFQRVREIKGPHAKICIFLDNASIHHAVKTRTCAQQLNIKLIFNIPYEPQFMGIELFWGVLKHVYK
jgi:hypothetical protein